MKKEKLSFYDVKTKKKFNSDTWKEEVRKNRKFAVAKSPSGTHMCWRVLGMKKK